MIVKERREIAEACIGEEEQSMKANTAEAKIVLLTNKTNFMVRQGKVK